MKNKMKKAAVILFLFTSFIFLIAQSSLCIRYASQGLLIWFEKMIPTLFPFMVLSGFMVRSGLSAKLTFMFFPLTLLYRITPAMSYGIFMGFFCGFPMGAKVISDLLETGQITKKQGEYLLAFTNNIGPAYLLGYVFLLFNEKYIAITCLLFYGIPLIYGLLLRLHPFYRQLGHKEAKLIVNQRKEFPPLAHCIYEAILGALQQINLLGGCMILFNCLQIYPQTMIKLLTTLGVFTPALSLLSPVLSSLTEIGGGLLQFSQYNDSYHSPLFFSLIYSLLTFGGLSCLCQTWFILEKTGLSIKSYFFHKLNQSILIFFVLSQVAKMLQ